MKALRPYADLCVRPEDPREAREMAKLLSSMGYGLVAVDVSSKELPETMKVLKEHGVEVVKRITLRASKTSELRAGLRRALSIADLIAVEPGSPETVRAAARDDRVRLVVLPPTMARYMDRSQAQLLRQGGGAVELQLSYLKKLSAGVLRGFMIIARRACAYEASFVVSSCAETKWDLWHPYSIRGLLVSLGIPENVAELALTAYPRSVVVRA